jgi:hypothetical protein
MHTMTSATSREFELARFAQQPETPEVEPRRIDPTEDANVSASLPPTDGGKDAWLFLFSCFMLEALIWGMQLLNSNNVT